MSQQVFKYLHKFSQKHKLYTKSDCVVISFSAGPDSMLLLYFFSWLKKNSYIKDVKAVHFNHLSRPGENELDALKAIKHCQLTSTPLRIVELHFTSSNNFESNARAVRYSYLEKVITKKDLIAMGHNLDDSLEWSLMQQFKVTRIDRTIGIPLFRGPIIRPLMSMSKSQILYALKKMGIDYAIDSSNLLDFYERNWIRNNVVRPLKGRYASLYRNYISQAEQKLELLNRRNEVVVKDFYDGKIINKRADKIPRLQFQKIIENLSTKQRGKIGKRIDQVNSGVKNGRIGPYQFSGSVEVFTLKDQTLIITGKTRELIQSDETKILNKIVDSDIPKPFIINFQSIKFLVFKGKISKNNLFKSLFKGITSELGQIGLTLAPLNSSLGMKEASKKGRIIENLLVISA